MEPTIFYLWENEPPRYIGGELPKLTYYPAKNKTAKGTVIIAPGGGYQVRAPHEGEEYALFLNKNGLDAFVLDYRVAPNRFPTELLDARRAVRFVRANAERFGISPDHIAIMGSSAGGHLAALLSTYRDPIEGEGADALDTVNPFPNAQILCYPVTDFRSHNNSYVSLLGDDAQEEGVRLAVTPTALANEQTPPAFIWHTFADKAVYVGSSFDYAKRLRELNVPTEMHVYPFGSHGLGLANGPGYTAPHVQSWSALLVAWLRLFGYCE